MLISNQRFIVLFLSVFLFFRTGSFSATLTEDDLNLEWTAIAEGRYMISVPNQDGTYSNRFDHWQCFGSNEFYLEHEQLEYEGVEKSLPLFHAYRRQRSYYFSLSANYIDSLNLIYDGWNELVRESDEVCFYAAYLQSDELVDNEITETWIISRIKTIRGEWKESKDPR